MALAATINFGWSDANLLTGTVCLAVQQVEDNINTK